MVSVYAIFITASSCLLKRKEKILYVPYLLQSATAVMSSYDFAFACIYLIYCSLQQHICHEGLCNKKSKAEICTKKCHATNTFGAYSLAISVRERVGVRFCSNISFDEQ